MTTVLVVDDHAGFRTFARTFLAGCGYRVVGEAEDGASGLSEARRLRPELVLVDVGLPDMDGFALTRHLMGEPSAPAVILVSTGEAADYGASIAGSGARGFLTKSSLSADAIEALLA